MLDGESREIFYKILAYLGVELKVMSVIGGPPDKDNTANNTLYFCLKDTNSILLEKTNNFYICKSWNVGDDEENVVRFLLENCIKFIDSYNSVIKNPFYGCTSLEAAAMKLDLLAGRTLITEERRH